MNRELQILLILIFISAIFSSCRKRYMCECNYYDYQGKYYKTEISYYKEWKRETATKACTGKSIPGDRICVLSN